MNAKIWNAKGEEGLITANTIRHIEDIANKSGAVRVEALGEIWRKIEGQWVIMPNTKRGNY